MTEPNETLNAGTPEAGKGAEGAPSAPATKTPDDSPFMKTADGLISTVERAYPTSPETDTGGPAAKEKGEDQPPFHEHPRWKEVIKERDEAKAAAKEATERVEKLEREFSGLKQTGPLSPAPAADGGEKPQFTDLTQLSQEEIAEWKAEDPLGYEANLARQIAHETEQRILGRMTEHDRMSRVAHTFKTYEDENPEFRKMWDSGELRAYMDRNPGHNAISAYLILTQGKATEKTKSEIEAAEKRGYQKALSDVRSKSKARGPMGAGPATSGRLTGEDARLSQPKKYGGTANVLLARHRERKEGVR